MWLDPGNVINQCRIDTIHIDLSNMYHDYKIQPKNEK